MSKYEGDSLGTRMKGYESTFKTHVMRRTPVIIRLDGRAFHTFVRRVRAMDPSCAKSPFSEIMHAVMTKTTQYLVQNVQNCVFGYTQSDEISLLLRDWDLHETEQWFDGGVQKMCSISASMASNAFNFNLLEYGYEVDRPADLAQFDSRVYNIPKEEVVNYFIWRQQDASRNSVQMLGHFYFSQKQMHAKNNSQVQDMLMLQHSVNWNDLPTWMKRGTCVKHEFDLIVDDDIPVFTQNREYIQQHLTPPPLVVEAGSTKIAMDSSGDISITTGKPVLATNAEHVCGLHGFPESGDICPGCASSVISTSPVVKLVTSPPSNTKGKWA